MAVMLQSTFGNALSQKNVISCEIWPKFISYGPFGYKQLMVRILARPRTCDKLLSETMTA